MNHQQKSRSIATVVPIHVYRRITHGSEESNEESRDEEISRDWRNEESIPQEVDARVSSACCLFVVGRTSPLLMRPDWTPTRTYSTADLCALIPTVSPRQLQWWDEHKLVTPRQEDHRRIYTLDDALEVTIIADLRRKGLSLRRIRPVLRRVHHEIGKLRSQVLNGGRAYIAITGKSFLIETSPEQLLEALSLVSQPCCVVDVPRQLGLLTPDPPKASRATA